MASGTVGDGAATPPWAGFLPDRVAPLSAAEWAGFTGKRVLITGAGGFLGSALALALQQLPVERLVLLELCEYGLYRLEQRLGEQPRNGEEASAPPVLVLGNVGDRALLAELFAAHRPQVVFHAAALKHVPLMEANSLPAAETNVLGTEALVKTALGSAVERFVLLSTDKAVEPVSVMGATKRAAELTVLRAASDQLPRNRGFTALRLPNVLGSTGSVAPLFARQLAEGRALTVTDPQATRLFLTRDDAVRLLLRAAATPGATGLLVPVAGEPIPVLSLARYVLEHASAQTVRPSIVYTGLRPGERLQERLTAPSEGTTPLAPGSDLLSVRSVANTTDIGAALQATRAAVHARDRAALRQALRMVVPSLPAGDRPAPAATPGEP